MQQLKEIEHGTNRGYCAHYRRKEPACDPCKKAHNEYNNQKHAGVVYRIPPHGTEQRYQKHLRERSEACRQCRDAHAMTNRNKRGSDNDSPVRPRTVKAVMIPLTFFSELYWSAAPTARMLNEFFGESKIDKFLTLAEKEYN